MRSQSVEWINEDISNLVEIYAERGVTGGEESVSKVRELMTKWVDLVKDVQDADALSDLYWTEVLSKVDVATYGQ